MMKRLAPLAVGLAVAAGQAQAQTTQCYPNNPAMPTAGEHCETVGAPPLPSDGAYVAPSGGTVGLFHALHMRAEDKKVGSLIADGKCGEARNEALRDGDLTLAEHVQNLCSEPKLP